MKTEITMSECGGGGAGEQAGNILIDQAGKVILADMGVTAAMARSHRLHSSQVGAGRGAPSRSCWRALPGESVEACAQCRYSAPAVSIA